jgi:hypothetical protein
MNTIEQSYQYLFANTEGITVYLDMENGVFGASAVVGEHIVKVSDCFSHSIALSYLCEEVKWVLMSNGIKVKNDE